MRKTVFERDRFTCQLCGWRPRVPNDWDGKTPLADRKGRVLTIDHILEKSLGGSSTQENFRTACNHCNVARSVHVGKLVREGQVRGLSLDESRERARRILGL